MDLVFLKMIQFSNRNQKLKIMASSTTAQNNIAQKPINSTPSYLRRYYALADFEERARNFLPRPIFGYVSGGVETGQSLDNNLNAFKKHAFVPKILQDVSARSTQKHLFSKKYDVPFGIAPMGFSALAAYNGDAALARAAHKSGSIAICSAASLTPLERVASEGMSTWFQCYVPDDGALIEGLIKRLLNSGFDTLVVTADVPVTGNRENNARNGFDAPFKITPKLIWQYATHPRWTIGTLGREILSRGMPHFENMSAEQGPPLFSKNLTRSKIGRDKLTWKNLEFIRRNWPGKLILKGVLNSEDAIKAYKIGIDGIIVSNHGGRQLDSTIAPLDVLPQIRKAVPEMTIMLDGGVRRGTDIIKALALGADFVFVGRPFLFAAAIAGEEGVDHAISLLKQELLLNMALLGINKLDEISPDLLRTIDKHTLLNTMQNSG